MIKINVYSISRPLKNPFVISRGAKTHADCIIVELSHEGFTGRGEAVPYPRYHQTIAGELEKLAQLSGFTLNQDARALLPASAARNALDCALWDLRAKIAGKPVAALIGIEPPQPARTAQTLSLATPEEMAKAARALEETALIKVKLGGEGDMARIKAIRLARPNAALIIDANEGWSVDEYRAFIPELEKLGIEMIEQPFPASDDDVLAELPRPIPICADESCHGLAELARLGQLYDMINIKLDKTGGLSAAIELSKAAKKRSLPYMIGCMVGSSLSMAPAQLLTNEARFIDLDGPLFLAEDEAPPIAYEAGIMYPASQNLWG